MPNNPVNTTGFWKERLETAQELFHSVFKTSRGDWEYILKCHLEILAKLKVSGKILDAGCGYGRLSIYFPDYLGIDLSPDLIAKARELYPEKTFAVGDLTATGLEDKQFDWAICISIKGMIERELGPSYWKKMEDELKRVAHKVLILEYGSPNDYEVLQ